MSYFVDKPKNAQKLSSCAKILDSGTCVPVSEMYGNSTSTCPKLIAIMYLSMSGSISGSNWVKKWLTNGLRNDKSRGKQNKYRKG